MPEDDVVDAAKDVLHVLGVGRRGFLDINVLLQVFDSACELAPDELKRVLGILASC